MTIALADATFAARQQRLRDAVAKLAAAIVAGDRIPSKVELEAVVGFCQDYALPLEAARVSRWLRS